jgi:hypothetical protein
MKRAPSARPPGRPGQAPAFPDSPQRHTAAEAPSAQTHIHTQARSCAAVAYSNRLLGRRPRKGESGVGQAQRGNGKAGGTREADDAPVRHQRQCASTRRTQDRNGHRRGHIALRHHRHLPRSRDHERHTRPGWWAGPPPRQLCIMADRGAGALATRRGDEDPLQRRAHGQVGPRHCQITRRTATRPPPVPSLPGVSKHLYRSASGGSAVLGRRWQAERGHTRLRVCGTEPDDGALPRTRHVHVGRTRPCGIGVDRR